MGQISDRYVAEVRRNADLRRRDTLLFRHFASLLSACLLEAYEDDVSGVHKQAPLREEIEEVAFIASQYIVANWIGRLRRRLSESESEPLAFELDPLIDNELLIASGDVLGVESPELIEVLRKFVNRVWAGEDRVDLTVNLYLRVASGGVTACRLA